MSVRWDRLQHPGAAPGGDWRGEGLAVPRPGPGWWSEAALEPRVGAAVPEWRTILTWSVPEPAFYTLEIGSTLGQPFSVQVLYASYQRGPAVRAEVATSTRLALDCRSMEVQVRNLWDGGAGAQPNTLVAAIIPGALPGKNQAAFTSAGAAAAVRLPIPPFARWVRLGVGGAAPAGTIGLIDGIGNLVEFYPTLASQPNPGIPCAGMSEVEVTTNAAARVVWELSI